jgi:hypothetical protein
MSDYTHEPEHHNRWVYVGAWVLLIVFVVIGLFTFSAANETRRATEKANELVSVLEDLGATSLPTNNQIVRVLGDDGGATCADPNKALSRATLLSLLANGATGPGSRPVIADSRAVKGQLLIIKVYCPDELDDFQEFVDDLKTDDVASD